MWFLQLPPSSSRLSPSAERTQPSAVLCLLINLPGNDVFHRASLSSNPGSSGNGLIRTVTDPPVYPGSIPIRLNPGGTSASSGKSAPAATQPPDAGAAAAAGPGRGASLWQATAETKATSARHLSIRCRAHHRGSGVDRVRESLDTAASDPRFQARAEAVGP